MSDTKEIIFCPACGKEMKKVFIDDKGFAVDVCIDGCGGIFFDNHEYKNFDEPHEDIDKILSVYRNKEYEPVNQHKQRICPVCGTAMVKNFASSLNEIEIDECYTCGGVFLDYGEIQAIRKQFPTEEARRKYFTEDFLRQYGSDIKLSEIAANKLAEERSVFYKTFLNIFNKIYFG